MLVNDSVTREAILREQMSKFLKFSHDDMVCCKYYELVHILFHPEMHISEFSGLTLKDIELESRVINIDHQLQRVSDMRCIIETTKTVVGTKKLPITEDVAQMPNITPHVCKHTYCSNMAKAGMNPKTLQYLMGHSDISVAMNVYVHVGLDDAVEELKRMEEFQKAQAEIEKKNDSKAVSQKMFKVI